MGREVTLHGKDGRTMDIYIAEGPPAKRPVDSDEKLHGFIMNSVHSLTRDLEYGELDFANGLAITVAGYHVANEKRWSEIFATLCNTNMALEEKVATLKALGFLDRTDTVDSGSQFLSIHNFRASQQLLSRVSGDMTWTNAAEMLNRLTNGWQRIEPKFVREKSASTNAPGVVAAALPVEDAALPSKTANADTTNSILESAPVPKPVSAKRSGNGGLVMGIVAVALVAAGLLVWIVRRGSR
jgi:hypothetical protein